MKIIKYTFPLILAILGFLIYSNVLYAPFIFDDEIYIVDNYQIRDISNLLKDFSGTRYIGFLSFAINYYFGELNTFGYHIVNVAIHIINAILVYFLVSLTLKIVCSCPIYWAYSKNADKSAGYLPFATALLFLVHPIQTQAVSYITQRFTSIATLFYLLALVLYVKARLKGEEMKRLKGEKEFYLFTSLPFYLLSLISAILAMKTKEISFTLPFMVALYEFTFFREELPLPLRERVGVRGIFSGKMQSRFLYLLPFFLTLLVIPLNLLLASEEVSEKLRAEQLWDAQNLSRYDYLLTQFRVIVTYIKLLVFPINQHFEYDFPQSNSILEPAVILSFVLLLSVFSFAVYLYFRSRKTHNAHGLLISFGILWFFVTISIESSIIPIRDVIFEHRLYLSSAGFILSLTTALFCLFNYLSGKIDKPLFKYLLTIIILMTFSFAALTYQRNFIWQDSLNLWLDEVNKSPNKASVHSGLGTIYLDRGMLDEALEEFKISIKLNPYYHSAHLNLGIVYKNKGLIDEAIKAYRTALDIGTRLGTKFQYPEIYNNLGSAYEIKGLDDKAIEFYKKALSLKPYMPVVYNNIGIAHKNKGMIDEAINKFKTSLKLDPYFPEAHYNLGAAYEEKGLMKMAKKEYETAIKLEPELAEAYLRLGETLLKAGYEIKAKEAFKAAERLKK